METSEVTGQGGKPLTIRINNQFVDVNISLEGLYDRLAMAQYALDTQVMLDMKPIMPRQTGQLIQLTAARSAAIAGSGYVIAGAPPMGRYLYYGKLMVDPLTGSAWARKGVKKILTTKDLKFWYPTARAKWFEVAKEQNKEQWVNIVKRTLKGE